MAELSSSSTTSPSSSSSEHPPTSSSVNTPLLDALRERAARCGAPFFVPGHKRGRGVSESLLSLFSISGKREGSVEVKESDKAYVHQLPEGTVSSKREDKFGLFSFDLTELDGLDVLQGSHSRGEGSCHTENDCLFRAQREASRVFGARSSWFLVNGSTCGVRQILMPCPNATHRTMIAPLLTTVSSINIKFLILSCNRLLQ